MNLKFKFKFNGIRFDTDEGEVHNNIIAHLLNEKYGNSTVEVEADNKDDALSSALQKLSDTSGYLVLDADYDMSIS
jgi:hypothetical protein